MSPCLLLPLITTLLTLTTTATLATAAAPHQHGSLRALPLHHGSTDYLSSPHTPHHRTLAHHTYHPHANNSHLTLDAAATSSHLSAQVLAGCPSRTFWTTVDIGDQAFNLVIDTGSSTTAVAGTSCPTCPSTITPVYHPTSTATSASSTITSKYGDGSSWVGQAYTDNVTLAGVSGELTFAAITSQSGFFPTDFCAGANSAYQGILGLGYDPLLLGSTTAFNDIIARDDKISSVVAMQMCPSGGMLWMGGCDATYFNGPVTWTPVTKQSYFSVDLQAVVYNGQSIGYTDSDFGTVIVDTGSASFILPTNVYDTLVNTITTNPAFLQYFTSSFYTGVTQTGQQQCYQPNGNADLTTLNNALPSMQLMMNGMTLTLAPANGYILQYITNGMTYYCPGIRPYDASNTKKTILGYTVLNQFITVFDTENALVGFAPTQSCSAGVNSKYTALSYEYVAGGYSDCSSSCIIGGGKQYRTAACKASNCMTVDDSYCAGQSQPSTSKTCDQCPLSPPVAIGLIAGASGGLALVIVAVTICCCRRHSRKRATRVKRPEPRGVIVALPIQPPTPTRIDIPADRYGSSRHHTSLYTPSSQSSQQQSALAQHSMFTNRVAVPEQYSPPPVFNPAYNATGSIVVPDSPPLSQQQQQQVYGGGGAQPVRRSSADMPVSHSRSGIRYMHESSEQLAGDHDDLDGGITAPVNNGAESTAPLPSVYEHASAPDRPSVSGLSQAERAVLLKQ